MKIKTLIILLLFLFIPGIIYADSSPPLIIHNPPQKVNVNQDLTITAVVVDNQEVEEVLLYLKFSRREDFVLVDMIKSGNMYQAVVSGNFITPPYVEYYLEARDTSGNISWHPKENPKLSPHKVEVVTPFGIAPTPAPSPEVVKEKEKIKPTGNYVISLQKATAVYPTEPEEPAEELMADQPGTFINYNLNTVESRTNKTITFWLNRDTESYTAKTRDKFRLTVFTPTKRYSLGNFYTTFSDLSIYSSEIRGYALKTNREKNNSHLIVGRSQEPLKEDEKTSPVYKQYLFGLRQELNFGKTLCAVNFAYCFDDEGSIPKPSMDLKPLENTVITLQSERELSSTLKLEGEIGLSYFDENNTDNEGAITTYSYKIKTTYDIGKLVFKETFRRIGPDYYPAGTLPSAYQGENDRIGWITDFSYQPNYLIGTTIKYDYYKDNLRNDLPATTENKDFSISFSITPKRLPEAFLSYSRLKRISPADLSVTNSLNKSKGLGLSYRFSGFGPIGNTSLSYTFQDIKYEDKIYALDLKIKMAYYSLDTAYKDLLALSSQYYLTDTIEIGPPDITTRKEVLSSGLTYNVIPFKFTTQLYYQKIKNSKNDGNINNRENSITLQYNYNLSPTTILSFSNKYITYKDYVDNNNHYNESIFTTKIIRSF